MRTMVMALLLSAALTACRGDMPPVVAANVVDGGLFMGEFVLKRDGRSPEEWSLNSSQLGRLNAWLQHHRDGWEMMVASPPPPSLSIVLTHSDGTRSRVDFFDMNDNWRHMVVVHASSASDNGIIKLSAPEVEELFAIIQKN